jgi:hypothetical protein
MTLLVVGMMFGPALGTTAALADSPPSDEVRAIVASAYDEWHEALGVRQACSSTVTITYEEIDGRRGEYRTRAGQVAIDPTDSVDGLGSIVIHELSHHTFLACGAFADEDFTAAFYSAQGLPEDRDWFDYAAGWSATPAEHFAEAMATAIHGSGEGGIPITAETTALVSRWLAGAPSTPPAVSHDPVPYSASSGIEAAPEAADPAEIPPADGLPPAAGPAPVDNGGSEPVINTPTQPTHETELASSLVELATRTTVSVFALTHVHGLMETALQSP